MEVKPEVESTFSANIQGPGVDGIFTIGEEYILSVRVEAGVDGLDGDFVYIKPDPVPTEVMVTVWAPGFDIGQECHQKLKYTRGETSEPITFSMTPSEIRYSGIEVEFYCNQHWLTQITFDANITNGLQLTGQS